jgi:hypothetical protein
MTAAVQHIDRKIFIFALSLSFGYFSCTVWAHDANVLRAGGEGI